MANVNGIEVSGTTYDIEDTSARNTASSASSVATQTSSDVSALQTTVNNISDSVDTIADNLQTVEDNIGDLADLETTANTDLVSAINEVKSETSFTPMVVASNIYGSTERVLIFAEDDSAIWTTGQIKEQLQAFGGNLVDGRNYLVVALNANGTIWRQSAFKYSPATGWSSTQTLSGSSDSISATPIGLSFEKSGSSYVSVYPLIIG